MKFLLIILLFAVIGLATASRKSNRPGLAAGAGGLVIIILGLVIHSLVRGAHGPDITIPRNFESAAGYRLGQAVVEAFPEDARIFLFNYPDTTVHTRRMAQAYALGFKQALQGSGIQIVPASVPAQEEVYRQLMGEAGERNLAEVLRDNIADASDLDAVVTFFSLPAQVPDAILSSMPPLFVLQTSLSRSLGAQLRDGEIAGLVTFRDDTDWDLDPAEDTPWEELFGWRYQYLGGGS